MANMTTTQILTGIKNWVLGKFYQKPAGGVPKTDLADAVQTSLGKADAAVPNSTYSTKVSQIDASLASINTKIPSEASSSNQLADKNYLASQIANFITRSVNDLANYYLKTETYTKTEVQALISAVKQFTYQVVSELPTASASTMNIIYLVPSADPQQQNVKDEFITIATTSGGTTTYSWEQIGSTAIDLSGYYTSAQTDAAITAALNTALASYYTSTQVDAAITTALGSYYTKTQADTLLAEKEAVANKVTSLSNESTDVQYPSAKAVYDAMQSENTDIQALAKLLVQQQYEIEGLKKMVEGNLGDIRATTINTDDMPMVSGKPLVIVENGAPTVIPYFIGQIHVNRSTNPCTIKVCYQVTGSISDWK